MSRDCGGLAGQGCGFLREAWGRSGLGDRESRVWFWPFAVSEASGNVKLAIGIQVLIPWERMGLKL